MGLLDFLRAPSGTVPPPGTSAHKAYLHNTGLSSNEGAANYAAQQSIPPEGTSAHKAYQYYQTTGQNSTSALLEGVTGDKTSPNNPAPVTYGHSAVGYSPSTASKFEFLNADLAKYYGMSKTTAYEEALANTAYQRAVKDIKDAGLNPAVMFGNGRVQSASASIYGKEAAAGGGGGGYYRGSGKSGSNGKLFSSSAYGALATVGGIIGILATGNAGGYYPGSQIASGAMNLMNAFHQRK